MAEFLSAYSIQTWLESCPQGYLEKTVYGHLDGESEPEEVLANQVLLEQTLDTTVQLVVGERAALAASSGLINCAPDPESKRFLATQTLDEARHVEIFTQRLYDLGVKKADLESTISRYASPDLVKFAEVLLEKVDKGGRRGPERHPRGPRIHRLRDDAGGQREDEPEVRPDAHRDDRR